MKRLTDAVLALSMLLVLSACGLLGKVDTDAWQYYSFEELGIALLLPDDFACDETESLLFSGQNDELLLTISERDVLFADFEELAAEGEIVTENGVELVRLPPSGEDKSVEFDVIGPHDDVYRIRFAINGDVKDRRAAAMLSAVSKSICSGTAIPAGSKVVRVLAPTPPSPPDYLVLVNRRSGLPENWMDTLDLVTMTNASGNAIRVERTVCKAYFNLRRALATEGAEVDLAAAYGFDNEHQTGLALDLASGSPDAWETIYARLADFGFILRYPENGTYYTGCAHEPGHIRYVGAAPAQEIAERGITLEEYLGKLPAAVDYLALVNARNALPDSWEDTIEIVYTTNRHGENVGVERIAYEAYCALRDALAEEGVHLDINSAYRSVAAQEALAKSFTQKYGADYVKAYVAVPGYSEHHTGLAIDLYLESVDVWAKIHEHLAEYGFILRYPKGKEMITGYGYEPWHVRFVGVETAGDITERGLTLEEYLHAA